METPTSEKTAISDRTAHSSKTNKLKKTDSGGIVYTYSATVEIPLGLKVQAKFQDDMIIDDFLQQVCHRSGLDPDDHYLTFNNKELDLDISCKSAGMHPNCFLKLFRGRRTSIKIDIKVVIQVKDVRFSSVFRSIDNLWFILKCLCAHDTFDNELVPIIIFMKQEFIGKVAMKTVTLRDLGITKGSCFLRFLQLKQEDLDQRKLKDDNVSQGTLESLELIAAGPTTDAGVRNVHFSNFIDEKPPTVMYIGGRCAVLFEQPTEFDPRTELHDEFFDTTVEEIQFMFKELQKTSETIMNMEEIKKIVRSTLEKTKQRKAYQDETVIRVYFPDSCVIQALFAPEETIDDVKGYLRTFLDSEEDFQLFLTPQKTEALEGNSRLGDLKLVPTGKLYFDQPGPIRMQYFSRRVMGSITSYENAAETALVVRGPSLIKFMNYSPIYGHSIADKILNVMSNIADWFRRDESTSFTKRNKLVPNWLKTDSSQDSLNGNDKKMTSFMDASMDDSWNEERYGSRMMESRGSIGRQTLGGKRKSILVENRRKTSTDYLDEKTTAEKDKGQQQRKPSSSKYFQNLRRRTTKSDHNRFSQ